MFFSFVVMNIYKCYAKSVNGFRCDLRRSINVSMSTTKTHMQLRNGGGKKDNTSNVESDACIMHFNIFRVAHQSIFIASRMLFYSHVCIHRLHPSQLSIPNTFIKSFVFPFLHAQTRAQQKTLEYLFARYDNIFYLIA